MFDDGLPPTIPAGKNTTMTFLRNEEFLVRFETMSNENIEGEYAFYAAPHWHPTHDELFRVVKGRMLVTIGSNTRMCVPEDGELRVPKGTVHSIRIFKGEHVIFEERTEPMDDMKELFFRNLPVLYGGVPTTIAEVLQVALVAHHGDAVPVLPVHIFWLESAIVAILGGFFAPLFGCKLKYTTVKKQN